MSRNEMGDIPREDFGTVAAMILDTLKQEPEREVEAKGGRLSPMHWKLYCKSGDRPLHSPFFKAIVFHHCGSAFIYKYMPQRHYLGKVEAIWI